MKLSLLVALSACALVFTLPHSLRAQVPTSTQILGLPAGMTPDQLAQLLQQNPQLGALIRQRLQQSGLTPDEIRAQLSAAGYSPNLLDAYLGATPLGQTTLQPGTQTLAALQALGLGTGSLMPESLHPDTGSIRARSEAVTPECLTVGNYVFGVDVFRRTSTQFLPLLTGPVDPAYRLGPGDILVGILTGGVEQSYQLEITRAGSVVVPQVGQIYLNNLTLESARTVLTDRLARVYSKLGGPNPTIKFDLAVARVRVNQIYVVGEVNQPGAYQISSLGTAVTALYTAGGITSRANMREIEVRRLDKVVATLDLYDYLLRGYKRGDILLENGDVVYVPLHGTRVQVTGAVLRPAVYELKDGETLPDLLRAAGGFRANAAVDRLAIHRILPVLERRHGLLSRAALDVALVAAPNDQHESATASQTNHDTRADVDPLGGVVIPSLPLDNGDAVVVDSIAPLDSMMYVGITGMLSKPGRSPWRCRTPGSGRRTSTRSSPTPSGRARPTTWRSRRSRRSSASAPARCR